MRGSAPLITACAGSLVADEMLRPGGYLGVFLLSLGVLVLSVDGVRRGRAHLGATGFAFANAIVIAVYTVVDGLGVRLAGNALSYAQWLFFLSAFPLLILGLAIRRESLVAAARSRWKAGLLGGLCTIGSYGLVLWAMTRAPLALVAALRETAVIFGAVFGAFVLREKLGASRYLAAGLVTGGAIAMRVL